MVNCLNTISKAGIAEEIETVLNGQKADFLTSTGQFVTNVNSLNAHFNWLGY
jgi:hypothetical protein